MRRLHLQEVAAGVLAAALLGHVHDGALQHLQQRLLHALPAHVPRDADVLALLHNLVNLRPCDHSSTAWAQHIRSPSLVGMSSSIISVANFGGDCRAHTALLSRRGCQEQLGCSDPNVVGTAESGLNCCHAMITWSSRAAAGRTSSMYTMPRWATCRL